MRSSVLIALAFCAAPAVAAECDITIEKFRFDDAYECADEGCDELRCTLKSIRISDEGPVLAIGGGIRERYEYTRNPLFGEEAQDKNGVWLQRLTLHGDLEVNDHIRVFAELSSAFVEGRAEGPSPVDRNDLGVQNAFVEVSLPFDAAAGSFLRIGRQELELGTGRLVDVREGANVRRTFNAVRGTIIAGEWRIDSFLAEPRQLEPGIFDDKRNQDQMLWGAYASRSVSWLVDTGLDLYYLGFEDDNALFAQSINEETRHSIGARLAGADNQWDWDWEAVYQFGDFGDADISAWTMASTTGYTFDDTPWTPRTALSVNVASGDGDPSDPDLGTFHPLFPRGNYFSKAAILGPRNFYNIHGFLSVRPLENLTLEIDHNLFWRLETEDGVYSPSGAILVEPGGEDRFVGSAFSFSADYDVNEHFLLTGIYTRFFTGEAINAQPFSDDVDFIEFTATFRF